MVRCDPQQEMMSVIAFLQPRLVLVMDTQSELFLGVNRLG